jgi:predicted nucleic acid-binding protein
MTVKSVQIVYWDSSAVLSALFTDSNSRSAQKWSGTQGVHFVSTLTFAEVSAVIHRMQRERIISKTLIQAAFEVLDNGPWRRISAWPEWEIIRSLTTKHPLRGADLWHLATAKSMHTEFPELYLLSFDKRLIKAAQSESLCDLSK